MRCPPQHTKQVKGTDLLEDVGEGGLDVGPGHALLRGGVRDGLLRLLVQRDDALEHANLSEQHTKDTR